MLASDAENPLTHSDIKNIHMTLTWSIFQLQCPLMSAEYLAAVLVLSTRLIL